MQGRTTQEKGGRIGAAWAEQSGASASPPTPRREEPQVLPFEWGQSLVETAMIAPILILMLISVVDFGRAAYVYSTLSNAVREGARTAVHTGATRPTDADVVAAVQTYGIGLSLSSAACVNGASTSPIMPSPTAPNTGWIYVAGGPANTSTNAPSGQAAAQASGGCAAINPSYAGSYLLSVTVKYYFQPLTPLAQQFLGSGLVMTVTSTMSTEY